MSGGWFLAFFSLKSGLYGFGQTTATLPTRSRDRRHRRCAEVAAFLRLPVPDRASLIGIQNEAHHSMTAGGQGYRSRSITKA